MFSWCLFHPLMILWYQKNWKTRRRNWLRLSYWNFYRMHPLFYSLKTCVKVKWTQRSTIKPQNHHWFKRTMSAPYKKHMDVDSAAQLNTFSRSQSIHWLLSFVGIRMWFSFMSNGFSAIAAVCNQYIELNWSRLVWLTAWEPHATGKLEFVRIYSEPEILKAGDAKGIQLRQRAKKAAYLQFYEKEFPFLVFVKLFNTNATP